MAGARRVAVTGLGLVNPFGGDLADFFGRMLRGESAIRLYTREDSVTRPLAVPAVRCASFDADAALGRSLAYTMDRYSQLGTTAALSAWRDAGLPPTKDAPRNDWGVSWGTALGGTLTFESGYIELLRNGRERVPPLSVVLGMSNAAASHISIQLGLGASSATYSVACASSAVAVGGVLPKIRTGGGTLRGVGGARARRRARLPPVQFRPAGSGARRRGGRDDPRGLGPRGPARGEDIRRIRGVRQHFRPRSPRPAQCRWTDARHAHGNSGWRHDARRCRLHQRARHRDSRRRSDPNRAHSPRFRIALLGPRRQRHDIHARPHARRNRRDRGLPHPDVPPVPRAA